MKRNEERLIVGESINYIDSVSSETGPSRVHDYLQVLTTADLNRYEAARGMLDDVMFYRTPGQYTGEIYTGKTIDALRKYSAEPSPDTLSSFNRWQTATALHVVRGMIQGKKLPVEQFGPIIDDVRVTMITIDGDRKSSQQQDKRIRGEITDVWSFATNWRAFNADPVGMRRAAEAYKYVGRRWVYGLMLGRVALIEKQKIS